MEDVSIDILAYALKKAKDNKPNKKPAPIFFLGAGASRTGGIPLANEIITDILEKYKESPKVQLLKDDEHTYPKLMDALEPIERKELLKGYIDKAKINVTHIYLAQLLIHGYVDYVLTVNFDNLMQRALALFNNFPPTYDLAILKNLTTTKFKEKSVVYLHGQYDGVRVLNTIDEMAIVNKIVLRIFDTIKDERPWVFIGYSGDDPIFESIKELECFENGLYWVTYNDEEPGKRVKEFLNKPNTNAYIIKGNDADSFMLKLNSELKLEQPDIIIKPFSSTKILLNNIVDIDDKDELKAVKESLEISNRQVDEAIQQFEEGKEASEDINETTKIDILKKDIIELILNEEYVEEKINKIEVEAKKLNNNEVNISLSGLINDWGVELGDIAGLKSGNEAESLFKLAIEKFKKAIGLKPDYHETFYNWGTYLSKLAETKSKDEAESLYKLAFDKYEKTIEIKPDYFNAFFNWGTALGKFAEIKSSDKADSLFKQAFEKFKKAISIKPNDHEVFNNYGIALVKFAKTKSGNEADSLYKLAFDKFEKAIEVNPDYFIAFDNWGTYLGKLAETLTGDEAESLFKQAFGKFEKAIDIKPDYHIAYESWGTCLRQFAKTKSGDEAESFYKQAIEKFEMGIKLGASNYNLACIYALISDKKNALKYLEQSIENKDIEVDFVLDDKDWNNYLEDEDFKKLINKYSKTK